MMKPIETIKTLIFKVVIPVVISVIAAAAELSKIVILVIS